MASDTCELVWLKQLLKKFQFGDVTQMTLIYDNQIILHISFVTVSRERIKHIPIDCYFI